MARKPIAIGRRYLKDDEACERALSMLLKDKAAGATPAGATGRKGYSMFPPKEVYQGNPLYELAIFDLRLAGSAARLSRARTAWRECAEPEILGEYHVALIVYPGGARSLAS